MPVLMAETNPQQVRSSTYEMDKLVEEVRERLCLKSREKLNAARRSTPYSRKGAAFVDSADHHHHGEAALRFPHRARDCHPARRDTCSHCAWKSAKCKCSRSSDFSESPDVLKQLLAEHRLIQEAVRRIHLLDHDDRHDQPASSPSSVRSISTDSVGSSAFSSTSDL